MTQLDLDGNRPLRKNLGKKTCELGDENIERICRTFQVDFKSKAKGFLRAYGFLAAILPFGYPGWEKLSIF